tara:strand:- start:1171 stop:1527 length:357 start_codon:yes stop_codon:yes gene_type:complete
MIGKLDSNGLLLGWYEDTDTVEEPKVTVTEEVWQQALEINANKYVDGNFVFEDLRTDEQKAFDIRDHRNWLLKESDWTQAADVPQTTKDTWATYRQLLRDVPQQETFPTTVNWPTKPS